MLFGLHTIKLKKIIFFNFLNFRSLLSTSDF